jgi:hypothetical protein
MPSTINTAIPGTDSDLASAPIRANFLAASNDINGILTTLSSLGNMAFQVNNNINITGGTIAANGAGLTNLTAANISAGTAEIDISGNAATVTTISGKISAGSNIALSGSGTSLSPYIISSSASGGTVTSVGLAADSFFLSASGSPITSNGTITLSDATHPALTLMGNPSVSITTPTDIEIGPTLAFSGANLGTAALSGDVTSSANSFVTTIANNAVTQAKMANGAANELLGYNNSGAASTVTVGSGLTLSGGVISNTGPGSGTVTQVNTGTGLTGGPITTTGTISMATSSNNTLAGYNNSGVFSDVTVSTGLTLSGGVLSASGGISQSSFSIIG